MVALEEQSTVQNARMDELQKQLDEQQSSIQRLQQLLEDQ